MKLFNLATAFKKDESGAVTVDWVVLTAAIVGIALYVLVTIGNNAKAEGDVVAGKVLGATAEFSKQQSSTN